MLKVLLVAPTIDGSDVGEAWVAHQWAVNLSTRCHLTVLTYRKRDAQLIAPQVPQARVVEWREPPLLGRMERFNSLLKPGYPVFYERARRWIAEARRHGEQFDVAHQVTPVAMRYPSPLARSGIPYLIGPVGGSLDSPPGFADEETGPWYLRLRELDAWRLRHDPLLRGTYENAACVLGIAAYAGEALRDLRITRFEIVGETGLPNPPVPEERPPSRTPSAVRPVRLLFVGRVVRTKGARDLVAAMGRLRDLPVTADIVGDGFDLQPCRELAAQLGVMERVTFHGRVERSAVDAFYRAADIFVFPSYREPGGNVVFEAMGTGLPLVVCDRGGPSAAVDGECAVLLPAVDPHQLASDIADTVRELALDPQRRDRMGRAARRRLTEVGLWESKVDRVMGLYDEISASGRSPDP